MNLSRATFEWWRDRPWLVAFLWIVPAALLPVVPIDETRYLSIAWEMRRSGDPFGLTLNGQPYMDKSPLLFWFINVAWTLLGVSAAAARLVGIACAAATVATVSTIARRLDHADPAAAGWILLPFVVFGAFTPIAMFDVPLVYFVALGMLGVVCWVQGQRLHGGAVFLVAASLGLLMKGPVYLVHLAGPLVLLRWWHGHPLERPGQMATGIIACVLLACVPLGTWAVVSALRLDGVSVVDTLAHQSVGRVAQSFAHKRNALWYLPWVIPFFLPWTFLLRWRRLWANRRRLTETCMGRLGVAASVPAFAAFSLISGKQIHYLLPLLPGTALVLAALHAVEVNVLSYGRIRIVLAVTALAWAWPVANAIIGMYGNPTWYVAALASATILSLGALAVRHLRGLITESDKLRVASFAGLVALISAVLLVGTHVKAHMDPQELADAVKDLQRHGVAVAAVDDEPGMVTYLARLPRPLPRIANTDAWARSNPQGLVLVHANRGEPPAFVLTPITLADGWEGLVPASNLHEVHP
ncbi:ArnT family glycosyltransferase [Luteibacter sp. Lutesp34]|uniref:ArnT family glycosyltransferase n=1 Tax=Luteibacter sp. Lutesp34 TaxID=3243030 RepID=UPI0039B41C33